MHIQIMFDAACSPELYQIQGKGYAFPDMTAELCPQCKADILKKHGFYGRYLITPGFEGEIIIRRYLCKSCGRTVSLLPSFCHPKRTYGVLVIFGLLLRFYARREAACEAPANFHGETGVDCTRQLLLHYRRRVERNLNSLAMAITDVYGLRSPPVTEGKDAKEKVRQLLLSVLDPQDTSLEIFKRTGATYLTKQAA